MKRTRIFRVPLTYEVKDADNDHVAEQMARDMKRALELSATKVRLGVVAVGRIEIGEVRRTDRHLTLETSGREVVARLYDEGSCLMAVPLDPYGPDRFTQARMFLQTTEGWEFEGSGRPNLEDVRALCQDIMIASQRTCWACHKGSADIDCAWCKDPLHKACATGTDEGLLCSECYLKRCRLDGDDVTCVDCGDNVGDAVDLVCVGCKKPLCANCGKPPEAPECSSCEESEEEDDDDGGNFEAWELDPDV